MDSHSNTIVHTDDVNVEPLISVENKTNHASSRTLIERFSGIFYALLSSLFFTTSVFITKQLRIDLLDALIFRFFFQTISLLIYMKLIKHYSLYSHTKSDERITLFVNAFFSTTAFLSFFIGYRYLPLPDLTTIRYTQVVWTVVIAAFIYREKPTISTILAMFLTILGVVCVAQPEFIFKKAATQSIEHSQRIIGIFIALYSSVAMSIMVISNRILLVKYKSKQSLILFQFGIILFFVTLIHLIVNVYLHSNSIEYLKNLICNWTYVGASLACLLQMCGSILIQKAFKREHPAIITIVQSSDILFSIVLQNIFTSLKSNLLSLFGSVLVLSSILIISLSKLCHELKK